MSVTLGNILNSTSSGIDTVAGTQGPQKAARTSNAQAPDGDGDHGVEPVGQTDSANVSALGSAITRSAGGAKSASSFRSQLVGQLQTQVSSGNYHPNPMRTAYAVRHALNGMGA